MRAVRNGVVGRGALAASLAGLWTVLCSVAVHAEAVRTRYAISLIGLPFGTATVTGVLEPSAYRVELDAKPTGIASVLSSSKGAAVSTGSLPNNHVLPSTYATTSSNADTTRTVRMSMDQGNVDKVDIQPPWEMTPDRVPVTDADKRAIVDPMSALIMPVPGTGPVIGPDACNRTIPVFDGAARFDIVLTYVGTRRTKAKGFDGPVAVCAARYKPIAGHRANRAGTRFMANNKEIEAWLAPVGNSRIVVPIHISVMTMIGTVVIDATDFNVAAAGQAATTR